MKKRKNDYSIIVFEKNKKQLCKMTYVHNLQSASSWLTSSRKYKNWSYFNVYNRRTGQYLGRYYRNNFIPRFIL